MADHDQLFKTLLQEFFAEFIHLFFAGWADRFDFGAVEFLQGEMFTDLPQGERRTLDLVARLPVRQEIAAARPGEETSWIALVQVEVESADRAAGLRPRMLDYYWLLRHRHRLPVLPIGLYLRVGLNGVGWDTYEEWFWDRRLVYFEYAYVGLPALDAEQYVQGENILGVALAALMRVPEERRAWVKAEGMRRIEASQQDAAQRFLLGEVIQTYLALDESQQEEFERLMLQQEYSGVPVMVTTWSEQQREKGRLENQQKWLRVMLERHFGPLSPETIATIASWSSERLDKALEQVLDGKSLEDIGLCNGGGSPN